MVNTSFNCICSVHCQLIDFAFLSPANPKYIAFDSKVLTKISFEKLRLKIDNFKITRDNKFEKLWKVFFFNEFIKF